MLRLIFYTAFAYVSVVLLMYFFQRNFQYFPQQNTVTPPKEAGVPQMQEVLIKTEDNLNLIAWYAPPKNKGDKVVVLYHGNAGNISHRAIKAAYFLDKGYGVLLCEYRGYGGNPGKPSEEGLYKDGRAALWFLKENDIDASQIVIYGESIGTGVAVEMARLIQAHQLILEAPFTSALDVAKISYYWLPLKHLMKDRFDSLSKIKDVKSSLLVVHGDEDGIIPIALGKQLYEAANHPKELITINGGGHSNLYEHHAGHIIVEWLDKQVEIEKREDAQFH
jgi:fermentation-respiration switch protein FrsA (DUF1100 family)